MPLSSINTQDVSFHSNILCLFAVSFFFPMSVSSDLDAVCSRLPMWVGDIPPWKEAEFLPIFLTTGRTVIIIYLALKNLRPHYISCVPTMAQCSAKNLPTLQPQDWTLWTDEFCNIHSRLILRGGGKHKAVSAAETEPKGADSCPGLVRPKKYLFINAQIYNFTPLLFFKRENYFLSVPPDQMDNTPNPPNPIQSVI